MRIPALVFAFLACSSIDAAAQLSTRVHASGFARPVAFVQDPTDAAVQFVVEQGGRIRVVQNGQVLPADFLNLTSEISSTGERGLLGMAFPPDTAANGRFFVNFTNRDGHTVVARFRRSASPLVADPGSRFDLRWISEPGSAPFIRQPYANHNGGHLAFGPDGLLYIGLGDGGSGNDPDNTAQRRDTLLGKMLRIAVNVPDSNENGYVVPPGNPFVGSPDIPWEVWSFGWRNPWRYSFDDVARGGSGALIAGDVGQSSREEINYEPRGRGGRNYGWRIKEGTVTNPNVPPTPPAFLPLTDPIHDYGRTEGQSVTGGVIYRGVALAGMEGRYFFGDFITSRVWSLGLSIDAAGEATVTDVRQHTSELTGLENVSAFGVDANGELYIVSYSNGVVYRVTAAPRAPTNLRIIR
jgi:glucose/arabinose dehydrogenase